MQLNIDKLSYLVLCHSNVCPSCIWYKIQIQMSHKINFKVVYITSIEVVAFMFSSLLAFCLKEKVRLLRSYNQKKRKKQNIDQEGN